MCVSCHQSLLTSVFCSKRTISAIYDAWHSNSGRILSMSLDFRNNVSERSSRQHSHVSRALRLKRPKSLKIELFFLFLLAGRRLLRRKSFQRSLPRWLQGLALSVHLLTRHGASLRYMSSKAM